MQNKIIQQVNTSQLNPNIPEFKSGDTVKVTWKEKERLQVFQGIVMSIKGSLVSKNIIVRKGVKGKGVEKTFPLNSPSLVSLEVVGLGQIRQAKPFYLRDLGTKALKKKLKSKLVTISKTK